MNSIYIRTYLLVVTFLVLLVVACIFNYYSNTHAILPALGIMIFVMLVSLLLIFLWKDGIVVIQVFIIGSFICFGLYLMTYETDYDISSSLLWLTIFPPLIMHTLGLRNGTILFSIYFVLLSILFFSPLNVWLNESLTSGDTIRLLLSSLGIYFFSWASEFIRFKTRLALSEALEISNINFLYEKGEKRHLRQVFDLYVSPEIVSCIVEQEDDLLNGEEREVTIMFTDLRGFTSLSEKLKPETAVQLLNDYFTPMTALIHRSKGTLDKFIGDGIMAFWNAPLDLPQHTVQGVETTIAMQEALCKLNVILQKKYGVPLQMGIGLHVGTVYVGSMGSHELLNYTIIGDNVNLASRLEELCPKYGVPIIISGQAKKLCGDEFVFILVDVLRVKGKTNSVEIYTPLRKKEAKKREQELEEYILARELYLTQKFDEAEKAFERLEGIYGQGLYRAYRERCEGLKSKPFSEDWCGTWTIYRKKVIQYKNGVSCYFEDSDKTL